MKLLVDAGNSCLKWALLEDDTLKAGGSLVRGDRATKDLAAEAWSDLEPPDEIFVANVTGDKLRRSLTTWMRRRWSVTPIFLFAEASQAGVENAYADPRAMGVDRWLAMIGAHQLHRGPVCVIDCGTAITVDALDHRGKHIGGLVMPGLRLMRQSLVDGAAAIETLPDLGSEHPKQFLANQTGDAIIAGTLYAAAASLDRLIADLRSELGAKLQCFITGGDAATLLPLLNADLRHVPDLVFQGMRAVTSQGDAPSNTEEQTDKAPEAKRQAPRKKKARSRSKSRPDARKKKNTEVESENAETEQPDPEEKEISA